MSSVAKVFALAVYDNEAESEDELTFKKNDLLQVLECDYMGMEGWWLCKLVKSNKMGLAAGNRLKLTSDEKLISKLSNVGKLTSNKIVFGSTGGGVQLSSILSNSSSVSSILSSSSSSLSTTSGSTVSGSLARQPNQPLESKSLPCKLPQKTAPKLSLMSSSEKHPVINEVAGPNDDDDDYDYDIPENNRPVVAIADPPASGDSQLKSSSTRKSISPTIDSGVSTSSLASLNLSDLPVSSSTASSSPSSMNPSHRLSSDSNSTSSSSSSAASLADSRDTFAQTLDRILHLCSHLDGDHQLIITQSTLLVKKDKLLQLATQLHAFLARHLKSLKQDHACFHPDLGVFNRFKAIYRHIKEFYFFYEASLNTLDKVYNWNYELIIQNSQSNEYFDLVNKIGHLGDLMRQLKALVNEKGLFDFTSETTSAPIMTSVIEQTPVVPDDSYQYDYDNGPNGLDSESQADLADYCTIDEEEEDKDNLKDVDSSTLKKSDTGPKINQDSNQSQIRRELRLESEESTPSNIPVRLTACDQMLIKFYLKHIEENLNDLTSVQHSLVEKLESVSSADSKSKAVVVDLAHKLAINGHKLVFICDTLQRNINNLSLKQSLFESSNSLCSALKVYMIRLKSSAIIAPGSSPNESFKNLILESINNVFECANQFKSIILRYYFKSF